MLLNNTFCTVVTTVQKMLFKSINLSGYKVGWNALELSFNFAGSHKIVILHSWAPNVRSCQNFGFWQAAGTLRS